MDNVEPGECYDLSLAVAIAGCGLIAGSTRAPES